MEFDTVPYKIGDAHLTYYLVFHITFFYKKTDKITSILPRALCVQFICKNSLYIDFHVYSSLGILQKWPLFKILFYNAVLDYGAISADSYFNETNSRLGDRFLQQQSHKLQPTLW